MNRETLDAVDIHIADTKSQAASLEKLIQAMTRVEDKTKERVKKLDPKKKEEAIPYTLFDMEAQIINSQMVSLGIARVMLSEFIQIWEQHRALSEYVESLSKAGTDQAKIKEALGKLKEVEEALRKREKGLDWVDNLINHTPSTTVG